MLFSIKKQHKKRQIQQWRKCRNGDSGYHLFIKQPNNNVRYMLLSEKEKEALVVDLLNKGQTAREIAKQAHISFTDIKKIRMKLTGEVNEDTKKRKNHCLFNL